MAAIIAMSFVACKKEDDSPATPTPSASEGFWKGTYSKTGSPVIEKMAILVKPGGSMRYYEMNLETDTAALPSLAKVSGTWIQAGTVLKISYFANGKTYNASLDMNAAQTQLSGPWSEGTVPKGNMSLSK